MACINISSETEKDYLFMNSLKRTQIISRLVFRCATVADQTTVSVVLQIYLSQTNV